MFNLVDIIKEKNKEHNKDGHLFKITRTES